MSVVSIYPTPWRVEYKSAHGRAASESVSCVNMFDHRTHHQTNTTRALAVSVLSVYSSRLPFRLRICLPCPPLLEREGAAPATWPRSRQARRSETGTRHIIIHSSALSLLLLLLLLLVLQQQHPLCCSTVSGLLSLSIFALLPLPYSPT